jgi:hypothetical protein
MKNPVCALLPPFRVGVRSGLTFVAALGLGACSNLPLNLLQHPGVTVLAQQPAEHALLDGIRAYETGDFDTAIRQLHTALERGLNNPSDQGAAHKYLAFIDCAFERIADCDGQFRAAMAADPDFHLSPTEVGHPVWGPVYRRIIHAEGDN